MKEKFIIFIQNSANSIIDFLNTINFNPENGDWASALVTLVLGLGAGIGFLIRSIKSLNEAKEQRKEQERARIVEEDQNFMEYRKTFRDLWLQLAPYGKAVLHKNFRNKSELLNVMKKEYQEDRDLETIKTIVYQIMVLLSDIEFVYCQKQKTAYWKRWHSTFKFVFKKSLFKTAFIKHREDFVESNQSFVDYVDLIIKENTNGKTVEVSEEEILKIEKGIAF
jgi:hypothetical protein